jgi:hypothetical protein
VACIAESYFEDIHDSPHCESLLFPTIKEGCLHSNEELTVTIKLFSEETEN